MKPSRPYLLPLLAALPVVATCSLWLNQKPQTTDQEFQLFRMQGPQCDGREFNRMNWIITPNPNYPIIEGASIKHGDVITTYVDMTRYQGMPMREPNRAKALQMFVEVEVEKGIYNASQFCANKNEQDQNPNATPKAPFINPPIDTDPKLNVRSRFRFNWSRPGLTA